MQYILSEEEYNKLKNDFDSNLHRKQYLAMLNYMESNDLVFTYDADGDIYITYASEKYEFRF